MTSMTSEILDMAIDSSLMLARMSLRYAKDVLDNNWHFYMYTDPKHYSDFAEIWINQAEQELAMAELQMKCRDLTNYKK